MHQRPPRVPFDVARRIMDIATFAEMTYGVLKDTPPISSFPLCAFLSRARFMRLRMCRRT